MKNLFNTCLDKINSFPLWLKQCIFISLENNINNNHLPAKDYNLSTYIPTLTFNGENELEYKNCGYDVNIYNFLNYSKQSYNIAEISLNTFLTLEETCKLCKFCIEQNLIENPTDKDIIATLDYMSGKIRLGEYFKDIGILSIEDLEKIIIEDTRLKNEGKNIKFGEILKEYNLIKDEDINEIVLLKEESKRRFILDSSDFPNISELSKTEKEKYESEINKLKDENILLKNQMKNLLELVKKDEQ